MKPEFVAGDDMVFVSINYRYDRVEEWRKSERVEKEEKEKRVKRLTEVRLGALGFFALPELVNATEEHNSGFYGIQDQRMAFWWVQQNIAAFGGYESSPSPPILFPTPLPSVLAN